MPDTTTKKQTEKDTKVTDKMTLILWNDDVNTLDDVVDAIIDICNYDEIQAEQCATIAHYKGKCAMVCGEPLGKLKKMKRQFDHLLINTSIE